MLNNSVTTGIKRVNSIYDKKGILKNPNNPYSQSSQASASLKGNNLGGRGNNNAACGSGSGSGGN